MIWEVEILPRGLDAECNRAAAEFNLLSHSSEGRELFARCSRGFLLEGDLTREQLCRLSDTLLVDGLVEEGKLGSLNENLPRDSQVVTVLLKPGVMDPVAQSVQAAAGDLDLTVREVRTYRRYYLSAPAKGELQKALANEAIEQLVTGPLAADHLGIGTPYEFRLVTVPICEFDDEALMKLSRDGQLAL